MLPVTGILMGMERRTPTTQQENHQQGHETKGHEDIHGWVSPCCGASAADQMGCPA
jgi:hypothetical protein